VADHPEQIAHAIERVAAGDHAGALPALEALDPAHPDVAAALAVVYLALGRPADALAPLDHALAAEPDWPLHHWNLAVALHELDDGHACYHALRRFVAASAARTGLFGDPDQVARVGCAERLIAELERTARLTGASLSEPSRATSWRARTSP
jgi:predicted O-linked N-acetylglucosamine transferase (SPINDLY family)